MEQFVQEVMQQYGYLGIFLLIFVENLFPPIPSEVILLFGGFMTISAGMNVPLTILAATLGSLAGALTLYFLGLKLGLKGVQVFFQGRIGKVLGLSPNNLTKTTDWFQRKGSIAVFICRFIPLVRSLISIPAGIMKMKIPIFFILTVIGSVIWNTVLVLLGHYAGQSWSRYKDVYASYSAAIVALIGVLGIGFLAYRMIKGRRASRSKS